MKTIIKKGILNLGEIKRGKPDASIEWELRQSENGPEFSASASVWEPGRHDISMGGQCVDEVQRKYSGNEMAKRIRAVWEKYHLNGMTAGLPAQEAAIMEWKAQGNQYTYDSACAMLKAKGLYEAPVPDGVTCVLADSLLTFRMAHAAIATENAGSTPPFRRRSSTKS